MSLWDLLSAAGVCRRAESVTVLLLESEIKFHLVNTKGETRSVKKRLTIC